MHLSFRWPLLAALLLGGPLLHAQAPAPARTWQKSIGLSLTPTWCYRTLHNSGTASNLDGYINFRDRDEVGRLGFDAGAVLRLSRGEHLTLDFGLSYASRGYVAGRPYEMADYSIEQLVHTYHYLSVPVQATYALGQGRLRGFVGGGLALDYLLEFHSTGLYGGVRMEHRTTTGFTRVGLTPRLTAGLRYALTPAYALEVAPVVQYSLLPSVQHAPVREHLYSGGVTLAVYRNI